MKGGLLAKMYALESIGEVGVEILGENVASEVTVGADELIERSSLP
jgi:hypothetical protein